MLTVMVVDDDPLLCTAMRRKIEMIDREKPVRNSRDADSPLGSRGVGDFAGKVR